MLLEIDGLRVSYGAVGALQGVSLRVEAGEVVALLGRNGAGKSTLLRAISGLVPAQAGSVRLNGTEIVGRDPAAVSRLGVAHVLEGRSVFSSMTVEENLRMGAYLGGEPAKHLARFPLLAQRRKQKAGSMSGGEQQILAVARALVRDPRLLMLDEPSLGLAPIMVGQVLGMVEALRGGPAGVLLVEQFIDVGLRVADRVYLLDRGRIVFEGPASEVAARRDDLKEAYLGQWNGGAAAGVRGDRR